MNRLITLCVTAAVIVAAVAVIAADMTAPASTPAKLVVGSPAPPLAVWKWIKGQPVTKFEKGKIYVVELWATWCPPCRASIPHLTELAKKYKGQVTFCGICIWDSTNRATRQPETEQQYLDRVTKFVNEQGDKMVYNVGLDDLQGTIAKTWGEAAKIPGIPTAFVIGRDGKIAAITHPMNLDQVLPPIINAPVGKKK